MPLSSCNPEAEISGRVTGSLSHWKWEIAFQSLVIPDPPPLETPICYREITGLAVPTIHCLQKQKNTKHGIIHNKRVRNELRPNPPFQRSCQAVFPSLLKSSQGGYQVLSMQAWMRWNGRWHFTNLRFLQVGGKWPVLTGFKSKCHLLKPFCPLVFEMW